jgi:hypothetical protein
MIYYHLSWFPSGRIAGRTVFWLLLLETTYLPQTVLVSGKMAAHLVATIMLYLSLCIFCQYNIVGNTFFYIKKKELLIKNYI